MTGVDGDLQCPALRGKHVLVVDDDADTREVLTAVLELSGALVSTADCAADAIRAFEEAPPDLLISDIGLPDQDGFNLLRQLRALPAWGDRQVPAIALTGYDEEVRASPHGFHAHLTKPVAFEDMLAVLTRALEDP